MNKKSLTVRAKKPQKEYELFYLIRDENNFTQFLADRNSIGVDHRRLFYSTYQGCWDRAKMFMEARPYVYAILITSNHGTSIVVKRESVFKYGRPPAK